MLTKELDKFFEHTQAIGSLNRAVTKSLYGINHTNIPTTVSSSRDLAGYVFFTRPQLNLSTDNIRNHRQFYDMLTKDLNSVFSFVRSTLDPRTEFPSFLVDMRNAFIPIATNSVKAVTGWPDTVLPTYSSKQGNKKEQWSIGDGVSEIFSSYDLDITFSNLVGDPILYMFQVWLQYIPLVFEGVIYPYPDFITENEIDYNTRIYRLVMDRDNRRVKRISATGASFPISVPNGKLFDLNKESVYSEQTKEFTIRFKCDGAIYNDPILVDEFNRTVGIFNPDITTNLTKIPNELKMSNNFRGYPYINKETLELEWYV